MCNSITVGSGGIPVVMTAWNETATVVVVSDVTYKTEQKPQAVK